MIFYSYFSLFLGLAYVALMIVYRFGLRRPNKVKIALDAGSDVLPFISIVIPARNEVGQIEACLKSILANDYPKNKFEILVIDDCSTDETYAVALELLPFPHKVIKLADFIDSSEKINAFKKKALALAISKSQGQYILSTDADCLVPKDWLKCYGNHLVQNPTLHCIAGPVNFIPYQQNRNWLYYFQSLDFMTMQGITIASNKLGLGNMSNGANFLFSRKAYDAVDGYRGIDAKASGDDMMLMQKISKAFPQSLTFLYDERAIVDTPVQPNWTSFLNQRIRWASKADSYPQVKMTIVLLLVYLYNFNFLFLVIASILSLQILKISLMLFLTKVIAEFIFVIPLSNFFKKRKELLFFIFLQPLHVSYIIMAGFLGKFGSYTWKDRSVH